jgi:transcription antitermination factor NusG
VAYRAKLYPREEIVTQSPCVKMGNESQEPSGIHSEKQWFALRTRARHEKVVRQRLSHLGFEQLLPTLRRLSQWKDRKKLIEEPLFPGYCFARFFGLDRITVLEVPGVAYIVSRGESPEPVPQDEITALSRLTTSGLQYEPCVSLDEGTLVEIIRGPLSGIKGRFIRRRSHHYVTIGVQLLGQGATVRINADDVMAIKSPVRASGSQASLQLNRV